ncbi:hypothetical protein [Microbispora bryophytorum]|uniref:hypothetical protein n=1 Tax=Microbispora bryophytorum TaxID=1460882 RepID=UPI00371F7B89
MLLAYVDESYTRDRYSMVALLVPDDQSLSLTRVRQGRGRRRAGVRGCPAAELHGTDLSHGNRGWEPIVKTRRVMIGVYHAAFLAIADYEAATGPIPRRPAGDDAA